MKKVILMIFLLMASFVTARECLDIEDANSACDISVFTVNSSNPSQVYSDANCSVTTYNPSGSVDDDGVIMSNGELGTGWHNWTFSKSTAGVWRIDVLCNSSDNNYARKSGTITVEHSIITRLDNVTVNKINDNVITSSVIATDAIGSSEIASAAIGEAQWDASSEVANEVDRILNISHSEGNWSDIGGASSCPTVFQIDAQLNTSHGTGNWTAGSATATITAQDKVDIANQTWQFNLTEILSLNRWMAGYYLDRIYRYP